MLLSEAEKKERENVLYLMHYAKTLAQVRQAETALRSWHAAHPDDTNIFSGGEVLSHTKDYAESRDAEGRSLGFKGQKAEERERVFVQANFAQSVAEIAHARKELLLWQWQYPNCDQETVQQTLRFLDRQETLAHVLEDALREPEAPAIKQGTNGTGRIKAAEAVLSNV